MEDEIKQAFVVLRMFCMFSDAVALDNRSGKELLRAEKRNGAPSWADKPVHFKCFLMRARQSNNEIIALA